MQTHPDKLIIVLLSIVHTFPDLFQKVQCPSYLVRIFPACNVDAYSGLTCAEFKRRRLFVQGKGNQQDVKDVPVVISRLMRTMKDAII